MFQLGFRWLPPVKTVLKQIQDARDGRSPKGYVSIGGLVRRIQFWSASRPSLVEAKDIPLQMRQAAVTENVSFVAGLNRYVTLPWDYEGVVMQK